MDLTTKYLGLTPKNPIVPSSSPLTKNAEGIKKLAEAGAAAVVMPSLFEEQIKLEARQLDHHLNYFTDAFAESLDFFPDMGAYSIGPDGYLEELRKAKESVDIPVIGSLNGVSTGGWIKYAKKIEEAGADALELNVYYIPTEVEQNSAEVEQMYLDALKAVAENLSIPVTMKLSPYFSATGSMVKRLAEAGASGAVLFNRFYQPDFDIEALEVTPALTLSSSYEMRLPLRWVALLYGKVDIDFAITSGIHTHLDAIKGLMAGAKITMMASALLQRGPDYVRVVVDEMTRWLTEHEYESVEQMQGSMSQQYVDDPTTFVRANYMKVLASWSPDPTGHGSGATHN